MAKKIKLIEIAPNPWDLRWNAAKEILSKHGGELEVKVSKCSSTEFESVFKKALSEKPDILIIDMEFSEMALNISPLKTQEIELLGAAPLFIKNGENLWPRHLIEEGVLRAVSKNSQHLDLMAPALVAGLGPLVPFIVSALGKIGFHKISITDVDENRGEKLIASLKNRFFRVEFNFVKFETITTLPGIYSFLINTTPLNLENHLLDELYFFNFLKLQGVVCDTTLVPVETPLLTEAQVWGARLLSGEKIAAEYDVLIFQQACGITIPIDEYLTALHAAASSVLFDVKPFLQRFLDRI